MIHRVTALILISCLLQCSQKEEPPPSESSAEQKALSDRGLGSDTEKPEFVYSDDFDPPEIPANFDKRKESVTPHKIAFAPETEVAITSFFEGHPDLDTINKLVASKPFRDLKETHLPDWQPDDAMKERIIESLQLAAAAQGVAPSVVGPGNPKNNPNISINIAPDPEGLRRVIGYLLEKNSLNYSAELLRQLDNAVMQSVAEPGSAQIRIESK